MFAWLLLLFIALPVIDLMLLVKVGAVLKFGPTVALVILTGVVGAALAKRQGLQTMAAIRSELAAGRMPTTELGEGLLILLAGAVLITPGFVTDLFGLALLLPPFRRLFVKLLARYFESRIAVTSFHTFSTSDTETHPSDGRGPIHFDDDDRLNSGERPVRHVRNEALDQ